MTFAVMAETHEGKVMALRKGFASREDAEAHPVRMKHWKRVWIAKEPKKIAVATTAPLPWLITREGKWDYIIDANGLKIASIYGCGERRKHIATLLAEFMGPATPSAARAIR